MVLYIDTWWPSELKDGQVPVWDVSQWDQITNTCSLNVFDPLKPAIDLGN